MSCPVPDRPPLRILHVMPSMHPSYGGPVAAMHVMAKGLEKEGVNVDVVTPDKVSASLPASTATADGWEQKNGFRQMSLGPGWPVGAISGALSRWLRCNVRHYDIVHVHGVFTFASVIARRWALAAGVPFILRPLGILNQWGMERRRPWLKKVVFSLLEKPLLDRAEAVHFTSDQEAADVARLKIKAPAVVIPLGLDLDPYSNLPPASFFAGQFLQGRSGPVVLFLSRIDEKKGIDLLLPAFQAVLNSLPDATLVIAGDGKPQVVQPLVEMAAQLGIHERVVWTGFLSGDLRLSALAAATLFCLPSRSENFGMALLEAMAAGVPCLTTKQVALGAEAGAAGAVSLAALDGGSLAAALVKLLTDDLLRQHLARRARQYAAARHSKEAVGAALKGLYEDLLLSKGGKNSEQDLTQ